MEHHEQSTSEKGRDFKPIVPSISPRKVFSFLSLIIATFFSISSVLVFLKYYLHISTNIINILLTFFHLDREGNIPTYFSSAILLIAALLLLYIFLCLRSTGKRLTYYWLVLATVFFLISLDEFVSSHELLIEPMQETFDPPRFLYFAWVIPGMLFVGALGLFFIRFLISLKATYRNRFILAGTLYVGGALGVEMISAYVAYSEGTKNFVYGMITNLEETFEMFGVAYFILALLLYIRNEVRKDLVIKIR